MGGSLMKSGYGTNGNRKKWNVYLLTLIILLVFGGSVFGLMRTQRVRDKRIFDILIKEKENQIISLQMHLQNEREHVQDGKLKADELKMKAYSLRAQKKELQGKIVEMQSAILSLKEEQKTLESAFEELQNETKLLRDKCSQSPQLESLTELLRQKEAEIDELHRQIQLPAKGLSVSKDDQSNLLANVSLPGSKVDESGENSIDSGRSTKNTSTTEETASLIQTGDKSEDRNVSDKRETTFGRSGHVYDLQSGIESKKNGSETEMTKDNEEQKPKEVVGEGKEIKTVHRGGVRLEARNRLRGNYGYLKRQKGNRLRALQKETKQKGNFGIDAAKITMRNQHFEKHHEQANSKAYAKEITRENDEDSPPGNSSVQNNVNQIKAEYTSQNEAADVKEENGQQGILAHSSAVTSNVTLSEVHHYKSEGKNSGSFSEQEDTMIRTEMENGNGNYDSPGIKSEVNKNQDAADVKDSEESEMVTGGSGQFEYDVQKNKNNEEEEPHTDDPEF